MLSKELIQHVLAEVGRTQYATSGAVGITAHALRSMAIRGFIAHNRESGAYALTDSGRATLGAILEHGGIGRK